MADVTVDYFIVLGSRRGGWDCIDGRIKTRAGNSHSLRAISGRRRFNRAILGAKSKPKLFALARYAMNSAVRVQEILCIGLTGGIGCGKTTVAHLFQARGAFIIDTDEISHRLTQA